MTSWPGWRRSLVITPPPVLAARAGVVVVLVAAGFWAGRALPGSTATPRTVSGVVGTISADGEGFALRLPGSRELTGYSLGSALWRDASGSWNDGSHPSCMQPGTKGQHITIGVIDANPVGDRPGASVVIWLICSAAHVRHYPVVRPRNSTSP